MGKYAKNAVYNKLVRDRIPEIIEKDNLDVVTKELNKEELITELKRKLMEEASEFTEAESTEGLIVELADLREIELALMERLKISDETVEQVRLKRREDRGGFDQGIYLIETKER